MDQNNQLTQTEKEEISQSLTVVEHTELAPQASISDLKAQLDYETQKREVLENFIRHHLVESIDYGKIHIARACENKFKCTNPYHFSKPTLFKPGGDKVMSLFRWIADFSIDTETRSFFNDKEGLVAYICKIYSSQGQLVASGRGACDAERENKDPNATIKIAQKRAKMDAIMSTGWLSDFFSKDSDDEPVEPAYQPAPSTDSAKCPECSASGKYHSPKCSRRNQ